MAKRRILLCFIRRLGIHTLFPPKLGLCHSSNNCYSVTHLDVLALDVVLLQPLFGRFTRTVFLVADIKETYWKVFHLLHPLALFQHVSPAGKGRWSASMSAMMVSISLTISCFHAGTSAFGIPRTNSSLSPKYCLLSLGHS